MSEVMRREILLLKDKITETSVESDEISAACARAPVEHAILAATQFRRLVTEVKGEELGNLTPVIVPCGLTVLDHWSPEVKQQGMIAFVHFAKNVNVSTLHLYEDALLDACCKNIAVVDEIWENAVETSVSLATSRNPRSHWYERLMSEMVTHLERQPGNRCRRLAWLKFIDPMMEKMGLVLLSHFKRLFPLFFFWIRSGDEETLLLTLQRIRTAIRVTWMRHASHVERLVDELALLHDEAAIGQASRNEISSLICLLHQNPRFEKAWLAKRASFGL